MRPAGARGVFVSNCPAKNSVAVAELVFALLLAIDRRIPENLAALKAGNPDILGLELLRTGD